MNNPEDKFMSPLSRPPASKKQRGGATPRPSGTTMMTSSTGSGPPPVVPNSNTSGSSSSTATRTGRLTSTAEDAIARRRAELRRLQAKRTAAASGSTAGTITATTAAAGAGPPPPPVRSAGVQRHYSDLFPTVPKSPSPQVTRQTLLDVSEATGAPPLALPNQQQQQQQQQPAQPNASANSKPPSTTISDSTVINGILTPAVNRKLEFPFSQKGSMTLETTTTTETRTRSKSAPPSRPPPPPPPPSKTLPSSATTTGAASAASKPPSNLSTGRPPSGTTSTSDIPFSRTAERAQARKEREASHPHQEANSPHLIPSTKTASTSISATVMATPQVATANNKTTDSSSSPPISHPKSSSTKREKINMMRNAVAEAQPDVPSSRDEPPTPPRRLARSPPDGTKSAVATVDPAEAAATLISESEKRLEEAYQKAEREKTAALVQIKQLEDQLLQAQDKVAKAEQVANKLPPPGSNSNIDYQYMLQLAETDGPEAAVAWVRSQPQQQQNQSSTPRKGGGGGVGPLTAMSPLRNVVAGLRDSPRKRFKSLSDRSMSINPVIPNLPPDVPMKQIEKQLLSQFREAVQYVPFEFTSPLATYVVRRPYGNITAPDLFQYISPMPDDVYMKRAHVSTLAALEVGVTILADNSVMLLFDKAGVRYNKNSTSDGGWKMIPNVEELDRPLGFVTYIDEQAKELEYSLDDILEEAMLVREQYSSSMINTALSLKDRPAVSAPAAIDTAEVPSLAKAPSKDVGVETDEKGMMTAPTMSVTVENVASADDTTKHPAAASTSPPADDISGSTDVLTVVISTILSSIFGLIYFVMIGLPLRIVQTVFVMTVVYALVNMMYFYLADDYNDWLIRETDGTVSHQDLAYVSNMRFGVL
ncbi:hypothetical protein IV203_020145 [Nitzschia inconspicua]|uniref:Uncharacterized protein n=1 Tax=Nitzschia inconspicua TaxID=303405 RepID=A0A9K3Q5X1_9STRA|nr:hypothetical protein IV203_020335 [Nitzschia inconspicua]KAG7371575.1 hypothetical protein IV203_020145 [Nitzschia inconspicua]